MLVVELRLILPTNKALLMKKPMYSFQNYQA